MPLLVPYEVFGSITNSNSISVGAGVTVTATDNTHTGSVSDTTDSNGAYTIDLSDINTCEDGDSITISCTHSGETNSFTFTLDISSPFKNINLQLYKVLPIPYLVFGTVTDSNGDGVGSGVTVTATDNTGGGSTTDTTDSNGSYSIDLADIQNCEDGNSITISCTHEGSTDSSTFTLDISSPYKNIDLSLYGGLPVPYYVFGEVTDSNGSGVGAGVTVTATDNTHAGSTTDTTDNNSTYSINLADLSTCQDGDSITILCTHNGETKSSTFTLDISSPFKNIDLQLSTGGLPIPYYVFGIITDSNGSSVGAGVTVTATDNTNSGSSTDDTDSNGAYSINLADISTCQDGDSITISCTHNGETNSSTFTLDISSPFKNIDLQLYAGGLPVPYYVFGVITDSGGSGVGAGVTVTATDNTTSQSTTDDTDSNSSYSINLEDISVCSDGDSVTISCTYDGESNSSTFTLDIISPFKNIDLQLQGAVGDWTSWKMPIGSPISWIWNSGQYNADNSMRATTSNPTTWQWGLLIDSDSYYYKSGNETKWNWIAGNA